MAAAAGMSCTSKSLCDRLPQMFVLVYTLLILNADLRSPAIKTKMTRRAFASVNADVNALRGAPSSFFDGLYDEITAEGLPISD